MQHEGIVVRLLYSVNMAKYRLSTNTNHNLCGYYAIKIP